jgi:hypothetical protein
VTPVDFRERRLKTKYSGEKWAPCFDLKGERHSVSLADAEIEARAEPAYESERSIVSQRLKEAFRRLRRQAK